MKILSLVFMFFGVASLHATIDVSVSSIETKGSKSIVRMEASNGYEQGVKDARAWVFLLDAEGKVVGNRAHWIVGGSSEGREPLDSQASDEFLVAVDTKAPPASAKVVFSKIILEDGTSINPRKALKSE